MCFFAIAVLLGGKAILRVGPLHWGWTNAANNTFLRQAPPNDGTLNTLGKLGTKVNGEIAFDILADGKGGNTGWLLMGGTLYTVDIATGATKSVGKIGGLTGKVSDIAVLPAM